MRVRKDEVTGGKDERNSSVKERKGRKGEVGGKVGVNSNVSVGKPRSEGKRRSNCRGGSTGGGREGHPKA